MTDLKFTRTHEWILLNGNEATIGITEHAQSLLGDLVFIEMPKEGTAVQAGDELGVVESVKAASDFYAPIGGEVIAINPAALENPSLVNQDPYGAGWLVKIQAKNLDEAQELLTESDYQKEISEH
jgi:glycine cleavage system H protein